MTTFPLVHLGRKILFISNSIDFFINKVTLSFDLIVIHFTVVFSLTQTWLFQASLYIFGGRTGKKETDELWSFDTQSLRWSLLAAQGDMPLSVAGHTATLVDSKMIVLFGYGPQRGYTDKVQEYDLGKI